MSLALFPRTASRREAVAPPFPLQEVAPGVVAHAGEIALMSEGNEGDIADIGSTTRASRRPRAGARSYSRSSGRPWY